MSLSLSSCSKPARAVLTVSPSRLTLFMDDDMVLRRQMGWWQAFPDKTSAFCFADNEGVVGEFLVRARTGRC